MAHHPTSDLLEMEKAVEVRDVSGLRGLREQASRLLARLEKSRDLSERRAAEVGRRDPIKSITGRSALDSAIAATRSMLGRMDALLSEFENELSGAESDERAVRNGHATCAGSVR